MTPAKPHILGIPGSLRQVSYSSAVLRGLQKTVQERTDIDVFTLEAVPSYDADLDTRRRDPSDGRPSRAHLASLHAII